MNKKTEFIFGLSSLIGLVITLAAVVYALLKGDYAPDAGVMIVSLGAVNVVLAIVVIGSLLKAEEYWKRISEMGPQGALKDEQIRSLSKVLATLQETNYEVAKIVHNIQDQMRDRIHELFAATEEIDAGQIPDGEDLIDLHRTNEMFYLFLVDNLKIMMDLLTGDKCAVTIKIVAAADSGVLMIKTFMRDAVSYRARKSADSLSAEYPYYDNTAFREILSGPKKNFYVTDDLDGASTYSNSNPNWKSLYNATLVCPIRMQLNYDSPSDRQEFSVLGFLCVDNKKGGLNRPDCIELVASIADSMFNHFLMFNHVAASIGAEAAAEATP